LGMWGTRSWEKKLMTKRQNGTERYMTQGYSRRIGILSTVGWQQIRIKVGVAANGESAIKWSEGEGGGKRCGR